MHVVSVGKTFEQMSNFWMVQFKKNESEPISVIRTSLKLGIIFTNVHINIQLIRTIKRCILRFGVLGGGVEIPLASWRAVDFADSATSSEVLN